MKKAKVKRVKEKKTTYQVGLDEQEQKVTTKLLNIANMGFAIEATNDPITTQQEEHQYYLQKPQSLVEELVKEIIKIFETTQHENVRTSANLNEEVMQLHNLLALPHLFGRPTQGKESLVDYSRSNVVASTEYLRIL